MTSTLRFDNWEDSNGTPILDGTNLSLPSSAMPAGSILQVVSATKVDAFTVSVTSDFVDITGLNATITPSATSSKILVLASIAVARDDAGSIARNNIVSIFRGSTNLAAPTTAVTNPIGDGFQTANEFRSTHTILNVPVNFLDSPSTTSAVTYQAKTLGNANGGAFYVNRNEPNEYWRTVSTITLMEIAG